MRRGAIPSIPRRWRPDPVWKLTIQRATGGYALMLEKAGRGGTPEMSVCHDGAEMFSQLIAAVPGMAEAAWEWGVAEMQRRMEAERATQQPSSRGP
jgi:hypothetical protein